MNRLNSVVFSGLRCFSLTERVSALASLHRGRRANRPEFFHDLG